MRIIVVLSRCLTASSMPLILTDKPWAHNPCICLPLTVLEHFQRMFYFKERMVTVKEFEQQSVVVRLRAEWGLIVLKPIGSDT